MTEDWYSIPDTKYEITKSGIIRRTFKNGNISYNKGWITNYGYCRVKLHGKKYLLHRILGELFIPNPENKPEIDHINRIRDDNRLVNLKWATRSENCYNRTQKGCIYERKKGRGWYGSIYDLNGKRHYKYFIKKEDAEKWRDDNLIQR